MILFKETTDWGKHDVPNHTYILNDSKTSCVGYIKVGKRKPFIFSKPIIFFPKNRTFKKVGEYKEKSEFKTWKIPGSKGNVYTVSESENGLTCSCPGFVFRGNCKHIKEVK